MKTNSTTQVQRFRTYGEYAKNWLKENEIKLHTVYVEDGNYNPQFIYINRIANSSKPKFRILGENDKVKNCIKITFNFEKIDSSFLAYKIKSLMPQFRRLAHGSCQTFLTQDIVAQILAGVYSVRNEEQSRLLY